MNLDKVLKVAVVGLGRIGWQYHLPEIKAHCGFELAAVADPLQSRLDEAKTEYGARGYIDYSQMLQAEKLDLVVIASPTQFHCEQIIMAFESGCDVFCEKPVAPNLEQMNAIIEAKNKYCKKFMAYQPHRAVAEAVALKHIISEGFLGQIYMHKRVCAAYNRRSDWQAFKSNGGGMLNNYGSHFIDQLVYFADSKVIDTRCLTRKIATLGDADDVVRILMQTDAGILLDLDINMASAFDSNCWQVYGNYGTAFLNHNIWRIKYFNPCELEDVNIQTTLAAQGRSYSNGEKIPWRLKEFNTEDFTPIDYYNKCYDYFAVDEKPFVDIMESYNLIELIEKCRADENKE